MTRIAFPCWWRHVNAKMVALTSCSGILLAFPGCGTRWYDFVIDFGFGLLSSQVVNMFLGNLPQ